MPGDVAGDGEVGPEDEALFAADGVTGVHLCPRADTRDVDEDLLAHEAAEPGPPASHRPRATTREWIGDLSFIRNDLHWLSARRLPAAPVVGPGDG